MKKISVPSVFLLLAMAPILSFADGISVTGGRVKGLHYDAALPAFSGRQSATFQCSASLTVSPPLYLDDYYDWFIDGNLQSVHTANATFKFSGPGKHRIDCDIYLHGNYGDYSELYETTIAVIGGPLSYTVSQGTLSTYTHDHGDAMKPWYLQYFDFDSRPSNTPPTGAQIPQTGYVAAAGGQLSGTTYSWSLTGPADFGTTPTPTTSSVGVYANAGSASGAIKARLTYNYTDPTDTSLSGTAQDDSEETPPPGATSPNAAYYSFTSHRPTRVEKLSQTNGTHHTGPDYWTYTDYFDHVLYDQNSEGMSDVKATERFPNAASELATWNAANGQSISLTDASVVGLHWTTRKANSVWIDGQFDNLDEIGLQDIRPTTGHPDPSSYTTLIMTQQYFAATETTSLTAFGILVQNFTNLMRTTGVSHDKS